MSSRKAAIVVLAASAALLAFTTPQPNGPLTGTYMLATVDGRPVPCSLTHLGAPPDTPPLDVLASTFIFRSDGSFIQAMAYRSTRGGVERFRASPFSGTTSPDGKDYIARWEGAGITPLKIAGDTLILVNDGIRFAYLKLR